MKVISGAGEFEMEIKGVTVRDGNLVLLGTMGIWDSETIISPQEYMRMIRLGTNLKVIMFFLTMPVTLLRGAFRRSETPSHTP